MYIYTLVIYMIMQIYIYIYICVCVCVCILQSSQSGVGNNSVRTINYSNSERLNIPGKELKVTDITEQQFLEEKQNPITLGL